MFGKLFYKFGYQLKLLQYYRLTQTIFFLLPERLQWHSKEASFCYSSHFSVTQFSVFQRSISSWSGTRFGGEGRSAHSYICCWRQWTGSTDAHCQLLSSAAEYGRCGGHILQLHCENKGRLFIRNKMIVCVVGATYTMKTEKMRYVKTMFVCDIALVTKICSGFW